MPKTQELIQPKLAHYLKATWYARWIIIAVVAASFLFLPGIEDRLVAGLMVIAAAYNVFLWIGNKAGLAFVSNHLFTILADSILVIILTACTGGAFSPYLAILVLIIVSSSYWYGSLAAIIVGLLQLVAIGAVDELRKVQVIPKAFIVQVAIFITMGVYVAWLSQSERSERSELIALGTKSEKERQQLLALINNMRDAVLVVDNSESIVIYNQAAASLAGNPEALHGRSLNSSIRFVDSDDRPIELKIKHTAAAFERKDLRLRAPDNSLVNIGVSVVPYIVNRRSSGHVLIIRDITQDKTIDREREEFVAVASHELRTPLTIAQSEISLLLAPPYLPENQESVKMLNGALRSLQQLSHIIKDLTNLSQVENEKLAVELEPLDPVGLLREFQSDYADQAKAKDLELQVEVDPALGSSTILTSSYVVREILAVFVANAIEFTDKGSVVMAVINPEDNSHGVTFRIRDTGVGISQSDQKKIFEKFFQSEEYVTRVHGGTGLGLYIAKQLAGRITARLWFETELGKGSTFYLWVPPYSNNKEDRSKVAAAETKDFFDSV
jgi:two-component system phosphate regulon sensor histidine kinase PhoR